MYRFRKTSDGLLSDDKNEVVLYIREDYQYLKEHIIFKSRDCLEKTDRYFTRIDIKKYGPAVSAICKARNNWKKIELYARSRYDVFKYQDRVKKRDIYIIHDKLAKMYFYYIN